MEMSRNRGAYAVWAGSILLTITALFHFAGYFEIPGPRPGSETQDFFAAALRPLWLFASLHWVLMAVICVLTVNAQPRIARAILLGCATIVAADAVLLYRFIGPFIGEAVLAAAAAMLVVGAFRIRGRDKFGET